MKAETVKKSKQIRLFGFTLLFLALTLLFLSYWVPTLQQSDPSTIPSHFHFLLYTDPTGYSVFAYLFLFMATFTLGGSSQYRK